MYPMEADSVGYIRICVFEYKELVGLGIFIKFA